MNKRLRPEWDLNPHVP